MAGRRPGGLRTALKVAGICVAVLLVAIGTFGMYAYQHLMGSIHSVSLDVIPDRPPQSPPDHQGNTPLNILVLGSQTRDGQSGINLGNSSKLGTDISDTAMLVHLNAERTWAVVASIPRDLVVPRPPCRQRVGIGGDTTDTIVPGSPAAMFDLAMNIGGPLCAVATTEQLTGIRMDHFVEIDFDAFQQLTDILGGVTVCVPPPGIDDPDYSGLVLGPGLHRISGSEALAFVRDRHGIGDGSDLGRIQMQQMFVSSLMGELQSSGTLHNPLQLYEIADAAAGNLTVDSGLDSAGALVTLAESVDRLRSHYVQYLTVPEQPDPADPGRLLPGPGSAELWDLLRTDQPLPGSNAAAALDEPGDALQDGTILPGARDGASDLQPPPAPAPVAAGAAAAGTVPPGPLPEPNGVPRQAAPDQPDGARSADPALSPMLSPAPTPSSGESSAPAINTETRPGDLDLCSGLPTPAAFGGSP